MSEPFKMTVLISGGGTTLKNLIQWSAEGRLSGKLVQVISNNSTAKGLAFAAEAGIPATVIRHRDFADVDSFSQAIFDKCRETETDLVVMGGFLRRLKIPADFENRVVNIHPSLIPAFCGEGFYGSRVHAGVLDYGCKLTGCTVHFVDDQYDHGPIIAQQAVSVFANDTPEVLAARVFDQECELYPRTLNALAEGRVSVVARKVTVSD